MPLYAQSPLNLLIGGDAGWLQICAGLICRAGLSRWRGAKGRERGNGMRFIQALAAWAAVLTFAPAFSQTSAETGATTEVLTTIIGSGATGNLKAGNTNYAAGSRVRYSFAPAAGYASVVVVLDGAIVSAKGTVTMSTNHYLWAYGNPTSGTSFTNMMAAPTVPSQIPYPQFFQKQPATTVVLNDPYCTVGSGTIAYPTSYLGTHSMPTITGGPLPSSVSRGVGMKDYWGGYMTDPSGVFSTPDYSNGYHGKTIVPICNIPNGMQTAFTDSVQRIKELGADHVNIYREVALRSASNPQLGFDSTQPSYSETDATIAWMAGQAKTAGLKFHEYFNIVTVDDNGVQWNASNESAAWEQQFLSAWQAFLVGEAKTAQQNGIAAICADWIGENNITWANSSAYVSMLSSTIAQLRKVFTGKIFLCGTIYAPRTPTWANQTALLESVDGVILQLGIELSLPQSAVENFSVSTVKSWYLQTISSIGQAFTNYKPPILWEDQIDSNLAALEQGNPFVDDGTGCASNGQGGCLQNSEVTDFSVQATAYEGYMEAIAAQTVFPTLGVEIFAYWYTDTMLPVPCPANAVCGFFPNFGWNIRDKPAETIVYQWFKK